ncbi:MAG: cohesin domain-containing protein [archaeon]|nr:cohesin domain-containing protein [archaeon]
MIEKEEIADFCILFLILVVVLFVSPASAQVPTVSIDNASAMPDGNITLPITVKNVTNLGSGTIEVTYNPAVVHVIDVTSGTGTGAEKSLMVQEWNADNNKGAVRIVAWDTKEVRSGNVIFANVTYKMVGDEGSSTELNITVGDLADYYNYTQILHTTTNGTLTITLAPSNTSISKCFIATAAYGTPLHEDIDVLRDFRDEYLMTNAIGKEFVKVYYAASPPIAEVISEHEWLRTLLREGLVKPSVYIVKGWDVTVEG